ncbi:MAG TPA: hypothetical protein VK886_19275 [Vicinamibacterales bacterium]|nr:hypothetical protein [Vicinamibacterales bacterium]
MIRFGRGREALHLVGAACHCVCDVVPDALTFPGELVDRLTDTSGGLPILVGSPFPNAPRGFGYSMAKL